MADEVIRSGAADQPVPVLEGSPFVESPPLAEARVAIVTTAGLRTAGQELYAAGDQSFRVIESEAAGVVLGNYSPNYDRSGWLADPNVVFPVDRLHELADANQIGSVASRHVSFVGAQTETLTTILLDSGPAAAELLRRDGVDVVVLTGV